MTKLSSYITLFIILFSNQLSSAQVVYSPGGADTGGSGSITVQNDSPIAKDDYETAMDIVSRRLPSVFRSLEIQFLQGDAPVSSLAYDVSEEMIKLGIIKAGDDAVQQALDKMHALENKRIYPIEKNVNLNVLIHRVRNGTAFDASYNQQTLLYEKFFSQGQVYRLIREMWVQMPWLPCKNELGESVTASVIGTFPLAICVSEGKIVGNKKLTRNNIIPVLMGVIAHEIAHKLGIKSERVAYALQVPLVEALTKSGSYVYQNDGGFLWYNSINYKGWEQSIQKELVKVDTVLEGINQQTELELCGFIQKWNVEQATQYAYTQKTNREFRSLEPIQSVKIGATLHTLALSAKSFCEKNIDSERGEWGIERSLQNSRSGMTPNSEATTSMSEIMARFYPRRLYEEASVPLVRYTNREDLSRLLKTYLTLVERMKEAKAQAEVEQIDHLFIAYGWMRSTDVIGRFLERLDGK